MDHRVTEFHCIMPIANLPSVSNHGIVSYELAAKLPHHSVAMQPVQEKRDVKQVPQGLRLHQYANLYFHARNPMMFKRRGETGQLCVLRISTDVLEVPGTVISDQNAASDWARFLSPSQMDRLNYDRIYAQDWRDPDEVTFWRKKAAKCAEVLVPHRVEKAFIFGAYARDKAAASAVGNVAQGLPVVINADLFFF
ncbi:hypothetical protein WS58_15095 [Burkholderia pseudomultivorans]|uniref:DarT domain-containing protein n=1 Tax=Burkholderia pseudomultivorans TaxID=1207504 RepID=A0A6P2NYV3_9BURK|nr:MULTISPECIES: DUF4433 domain-containing protein [Burkholderia]KVC43635.1 hypothetical protein WS58_15095 [Burkholderia pseudomultivorans]MDN7900757.1 DUF4433 domain-containing protein [Burkholderia cepacia]RQZ68178.1 DUF4433 domain-containing protein [Burkholderia glumae]VWB99788.1 hypothetical protein BPS26883_04831 [Burkholderia pseudomultivorans]